MNKVSGFAKRHKVLVALFILVVAVVGWWKYEFPSASWRYKITVTVETPEGVKAGNAVREVHASVGMRVGDISGGGAGIYQGEAVIIDIEGHCILFSLLENDNGDASDIVFKTFPYNGAPITRKGLDYYSHLKTEKVSILGKGVPLPRLVVFKNLNDPMTVKLVDIRDLESACGKNVKLKDIEIELMREPVTKKIDTYLPWLSGLKGSYLDGGFTSKDAPLGLHAGHFKRGTE